MKPRYSAFHLALFSICGGPFDFMSARNACGDRCTAKVRRVARQRVPRHSRLAEGATAHLLLELGHKERQVVVRAEALAR
jgi:hypothetical protein